MTDLGVARSRAAVAADTAPTHSYVDWAAALAGAFIACAIFVVLTTFGSAIGLTLTSPYPGSGFSGRVATWVIGIWELWVAVSAFAVGGYIAGRPFLNNKTGRPASTRTAISVFRVPHFTDQAWLVATLIRSQRVKARGPVVVPDGRVTRRHAVRSEGRGHKTPFAKASRGRG